jgi:hypothetical protein
MKNHSKSDLEKSHQSLSHLNGNGVDEEVISVMQLNYAAIFSAT